MFSVTAVYPNATGSRFDADYYLGRHTDLARTLLSRHGAFEIHVAIGEAALDGAAPPFWAVAEMRFASRSAFDAAMAESGAALFADTANYTDVAPVLQINRTYPSADAREIPSDA